MLSLMEIYNGEKLLSNLGVQCKFCEDIEDHETTVALYTWSVTNEN